MSSQTALQILMLQAPLLNQMMENTLLSLIYGICSVCTNSIISVPERKKLK